MFLQEICFYVILIINILNEVFMSIKQKSLNTNNIINIVISIIILCLAIYPFFKNYKYNDNSKNWLNHDYGKNLLSSTEEYSVFMTEGGDNQVFSSLYFTYAEKLRQDLFPYDQKGNIFKHIYGDLRYVTYQTLEERKIIVDKGLFTGQEPFYNAIRTSAPPYLVPYSLGHPSTYLTWKLPDPQNLGNFYYKNYGLMYKVQKIQYAIIDYLEISTTAPITEVRQYIQKVLSRTINNNEWTDWLNILIKEKLISVKNGYLTLIKSYSKPFIKDPTESFITRWDDINNIQYYDYLSREIITSYSYDQITFISDHIKNMEYLYNIENNPKIKLEINSNIQAQWKKVFYFIQLAEKTGFDSISALHNIGIFYLSLKNNYQSITNDYSLEAIKLWEQVTKQFIYSWSTYNILLWSYLQQALLAPDRANNYLEKFDNQYNQMTNAMMHWKNMKRNIKRAKPYQSMEGLVNIRHNFNNFAGIQFEKEQKIALTMINGDPKEINLGIVNNYISKVINQLTFLPDTKKSQLLTKNWLILWSKVKNNPEFISWHLSALFSIASYKNIVEPKLYTQTLNDLQKTTPNKVTNGKQLEHILGIFRLAQILGRHDLIIKYKQQILTDAKDILTAGQYTKIQQTLNSIQ